MNINEKTAAMIIDDDVEIINVGFNRDQLNSYSYISKVGWLDKNLKIGDFLIVPVGKLMHHRNMYTSNNIDVVHSHINQQNLKVVRFMGYGSIEEIEINDIDINYHYIIGKSLEDVNRWCKAMSDRDEVIQNIKKLRIQNIRQQIKERLYNQITSSQQVEIEQKD